ncbi:MAG TPA: hypothetical protein VGK47_09325, partial [Nitrososphaeraceae archaeon]
DFQTFMKRLKQKSVRVYFKKDTSDALYAQVIRSIRDEGCIDSVVELDTLEELMKDISYELDCWRNEVAEIPTNNTEMEKARSLKNV